MFFNFLETKQGMKHSIFKFALVKFQMSNVKFAIWRTYFLTFSNDWKNDFLFFFSRSKMRHFEILTHSRRPSFGFYRRKVVYWQWNEQVIFCLQLWLYNLLTMYWVAMDCWNFKKHISYTASRPASNSKAWIMDPRVKRAMPVPEILNTVKTKAESFKPSHFRWTDHHRKQHSSSYSMQMNIWFIHVINFGKTKPKMKKYTDCALDSWTNIKSGQRNENYSRVKTMNATVAMEFGVVWINETKPEWLKKQHIIQGADKVLELIHFVISQWLIQKPIKFFLQLNRNF